MKHDDLQKVGASWLRRFKNCQIVLEDFHSICNLRPDVIGFLSFQSFMIEVKVSRSDFLKDRKKRHVIDPTKHVGQNRWYLVPEGLVRPDELPDGWGLLEAPSLHASRIKETIKSGSFEPCALSERAILFSALRKLKIASPKELWEQVT